MDVQLGTLHGVDGPHGPRLVEIEVEALASLSSEGLEGLLRVHCQGDLFAVYQLLQEWKEEGWGGEGRGGMGGIVMKTDKITPLQLSLTKVPDMKASSNSTLILLDASVVGTICHNAVFPVLHTPRTVMYLSHTWQLFFGQ